MPNPKTPGVSIEEITKLPYSVELVETAIPAFIGYTEFQPEDYDEPLKISSLLQYGQYFGKAKKETIQLKDTENQETKLVVPDAKFLMYYSLQMYFANGGGECYIVSVGDYSSAEVQLSSLEEGLQMIEEISEPILVVFPDAVSLTEPEFYSIYNQTIEKLDTKNWFAIFDTYNGISTKPENISTISSFRTAINSTSNTAAYFPHLKTILNYSFDDQALIIHTNTEDEQVGSANGLTLKSLQVSDSSLYNEIKEAIKSLKVILPPSSSVAGIYGRIDSTRGVWKAPANVSLNYVIAPTEKISDEEQADLNIHISGKSINVIRAFTGKGTLIWGARTLDGRDKIEDDDNEWKYVHVRRYCNMIEQSISVALKTFINEPTIPATYLRAKTMLENFLNQQWIDGALAGNTPKEAYRVEVDGSKDVNDNNILDAKIEIALVRPAEFIRLNFSHKLQQS